MHARQEEMLLIHLWKTKKRIYASFNYAGGHENAEPSQIYPKEKFKIMMENVQIEQVFLWNLAWASVLPSATTCTAGVWSMKSVPAKFFPLSVRSFLSVRCIIFIQVMSTICGGTVTQALPASLKDGTVSRKGQVLGLWWTEKMILKLVLCGSLSRLWDQLAAPVLLYHHIWSTWLE